MILYFQDEVVRGSLVLLNGKLMWPPPKIAQPSPPPPKATAATQTDEAAVKPIEETPFMKNLKTAALYATGEKGKIFYMEIDK